MRGELSIGNQSGELICSPALAVFTVTFFLRASNMTTAMPSVYTLQTGTQLHVGFAIGIAFDFGVFLQMFQKPHRPGRPKRGILCRTTITISEHQLGVRPMAQGQNPDVAKVRKEISSLVVMTMWPKLDVPLLIETTSRSVFPMVRCHCLRSNPITLVYCSYAKNECPLLPEERNSRVHWIITD
jgi:hypothetical protein